MQTGRAGALDILAPAKINLYLNVTGRLDNGFHTLDSVVAFADAGDRLLIEPAGDFDFVVKGPFARGFTAAELDASPNSRNLVARAAWAMANAARRDLRVRMVLTKNVPIASGLGGGSSDAAAAMWGLMERWGLDAAAQPWLPALAASLGADVPVCLACRPTRMRGIGEQLEALPELPEIPVLLVNPAIACPTGEVFRRFARPFSAEARLPEGLGIAALLDVLQDNHNDLTEAAVNLVPEISFALEAMKAQPGCLMARMSGSGATCFALFHDPGAVLDAAEHIVRTHPGWWVRAATLNRPERY
jgi:4-diphosphocytidyl-2-C-methyl-D-erythritol kinase